MQHNELVYNRLCVWFGWPQKYTKIYILLEVLPEVSSKIEALPEWKIILLSCDGSHIIRLKSIDIINYAVNALLLI